MRHKKTGAVLHPFPIVAQSPSVSSPLGVAAVWAHTTTSKFTPSQENVSDTDLVFPYVSWHPHPQPLSRVRGERGARSAGRGFGVCLEWRKPQDSDTFASRVCLDNGLPQCLGHAALFAATPSPLRVWLSRVPYECGCLESPTSAAVSSPLRVRLSRVPYESGCLESASLSRCIFPKPRPSLGFARKRC
jgi:hypothetical protein